MTSSLRNSIHRRNHKERSQLAHRAKLGLLEKHSDYVKRARDYHSKQDRLTRLKQKAAERNKDEFYFSMVKEKTKRGVHVKSRGNVALPTDMVKVLKTQDENYVRTMRASNMKKIDKMKHQLSTIIDLAGSGGGNFDDEAKEVLQRAGILSKNKGKQRQKRHIVFVEDPASVQYSKYLHEKSTPTEGLVNDSDRAEPTDLGWTLPNSRKGKGKASPAAIGADFGNDEDLMNYEGEASAEHQARLIKELSARLNRDKQLRHAQREFELQRLMMGKGARRKIQGAEPVDGRDDDEEDEDALDARGGRSKKTVTRVDESTYKPRVYKWRLERKR
ncbi:small-subunit processome [Marasmius fiardii PR-910]|nr:small-subunit processome [Marasmius fiardii PR-910]